MRPIDSLLHMDSNLLILIFYYYIVVFYDHATDKAIIKTSDLYTEHVL